ncbi:MAG: ribonuclease PH [Candidatus Omnitrophota bacterium]|nr:ribonuclease PH [Candidatus Omnitrophota bacterium]
MPRPDGRNNEQLRKVTISRNYIKHAEGSCLIELGHTKVICTASCEETVPPFLRGSGTGWITAEYGMLPRSTHTRINREREKVSGRTFEIQRLIGRSLRSIFEVKKIGERTIKIDCDVIQADGGTRTAAITGGFIALADCLIRMKKEGSILDIPIKDYIAATSVGIYQNQFILDLAYTEDSKAQVDMNVVMTGEGKFVEVQATAEKESFSKEDMDKMLHLAKNGIEELVDIQRNIYKDILNYE